MLAKLAVSILIWAAVMCAQNPTPVGVIVAMSDGTYKLYKWADLTSYLPPGPTGPVGPQGIPGPVGPSGPQGLQGPQGLEGIPGLDGAPGPQGVQGVQGPAGPVGITWRGAWSDTVDYQRNNAVLGLTGDAWIALQDVPRGAGAPVVSDANWGMLASRGLTGTTGPIGPQGLRGEPGLGWTGPAGPKGDRGDKGDAGGVQWRGLWYADNHYVLNDIVYWNSVAWIAILETPTGQLSEVPGASVATQWAMFAGGQYYNLLLPPGVPHP